MKESGGRLWGRNRWRIARERQGKSCCLLMYCDKPLSFEILITTLALGTKVSDC